MKKALPKMDSLSLKKESPRMVLLIIGNALFSVCGVMTALYAKYIIDAAQNADKNALIKTASLWARSYFYRHFSRLFAKHLRREYRAKSR